MPSAKPLESASPRPSPIELSVSPRRWNGAKMSSCRSAAIPTPWSTTRISASSAEAAGRHPHSPVDRRVACRVGEDVHEHALQQHRIGLQRRQVGVESELDIVWSECEFVDGREHHTGRVDGRQRNGQHPGLHSADVEEVGDEGGEGGEALVGGGEQLRPVVGRELDARGAESADRGDGGSERAAEVMAHGRQQRGAHLVGLGQHASLTRGLGELEVLERRAELGDDDVEESPLRGLQVTAVQLEGRAW